MKNIQDGGGSIQKEQVNETTQQQQRGKEPVCEGIQPSNSQHDMPVRLSQMSANRFALLGTAEGSQAQQDNRLTECEEILQNAVWTDYLSSDRGRKQIVKNIDKPHAATTVRWEPVSAALSDSTDVLIFSMGIWILKN